MRHYVRVSLKKIIDMPTKRAKLNFSVHIPSEPTDDDLLFARQLGVECVFTAVKENQTSLEALQNLKQKVDDAGLILNNVSNQEVWKCDRIILNLPGRDEKIEAFKSYLRNLSKAGIYTTTFTWEQAGVWSSEERTESRFASARQVKMAELDARPLTHGRVYSDEEIWDNFEYFMRRIIPVAEETGVRLALHPNDPPMASLGGVPCLIHSLDSYKRAFEIADSPQLGMEFCCGCWLEGGSDGFGDILEGIRWCSELGRICIVHFRNVDAPLPNFVEAFLDDGYMDMYKIMKILVETEYQGTVTLDHTPTIVPSFGPGTGTGYAIGYMRALRERAEDEIYG